MKILAMSGFVPEHVCDIVRFVKYSGERNIAHYCGYANDYISQVINDQSIDGAVFPRSCDSSRSIMNYLGMTNKFKFQFEIPSRFDNSAINFYSRQIAKYKNEVEEFYKIKLDDIEHRVEMLNHRNSVIASHYENIEKISYSEYIQWIHRMLCRPLVDDYTVTFEESKRCDKRVWLMGSTFSNYAIAEIIENNGMKIVGDSIPESGRVQGSIINDRSSDIYYDIANNILSRKLSPTQNDFQKIIDTEINLIMEKTVNAVIYVTQKYCEPYDYLYVALSKILKDSGIPVLRIQLTDSQDDRKAELMLEAFADTL